MLPLTSCSGVIAVGGRILAIEVGVDSALVEGSVGTGALAAVATVVAAVFVVVGVVALAVADSDLNTSLGRRSWYYGGWNIHG